MICKKMISFFLHMAFFFLGMWLISWLIKGNFSEFFNFAFFDYEEEFIEPVHVMVSEVIFILLMNLLFFLQTFVSVFKIFGLKLSFFSVFYIYMLMNYVVFFKLIFTLYS